MGEKTSAPAGTTKKLKVAGLTNACKVLPWRLPEDILTKPARSLTLWEAAYAVAYLDQVGFIELCDPAQTPRPPEYKKGCTQLVWPGPNPGCANRFCVHLKPKVMIGQRTITFLYFSNYDGADQPTGISEVPLLNVDVRNVIMIYHLAKALYRLEYTHAIEVTKIFHVGIGGYTGTRSPSIVNGKPANPWNPLDAHRSGRAIDFGGVAHVRDGVEERLMVLADWGHADLPANAEKGMVANGKEKKGYWPTHVDADPNKQSWVDANWKKIGYAAADAMLKADKRPQFRETFYRLHGDVPPGDDDKPVHPDTKRKRAAIVFETAFEKLAQHATLTNGSVHDAATIPAGAMGTGPSDRNHRNHGALLHPDTAEPIDRAPHIDHVHAQVGFLEYEYPDQEAYDAAQAATAPADQVWNPMPKLPAPRAGFSKKGKPLEDTLAPEDPANPDA